jgi:glycosyltransferase involved in cell wall biosynthesis
MRALVITTDIDRAETNLLIGLQNQGVELHAICDPEAIYYPTLQQAGVPVTPMRITKRIQRTAIRTIRDKLVREQFDIVHVLRKIALSNSVLASRGIPSKLIAYRGIVGNVSFFDPLSWLTFLNPKVERVLCVAEAIRKFFLEMRVFSFKLPEEKFITIYKGHDIRWYEQKAPYDWTSLGLPRNAIVIGCVANMRPRKGVDVLIRAFEYLPENLPIHLVLVGEVRDKKITRAYKKSKAQRRIHFMGFRHDASSLGGSFNVFVMPSLRREGLGRSLIEAMAQGIPAVVTNVGGNPEVVEDYKNGRVIPPGDPEKLADAIDFLISDPDRLKEYGRSAQEHIRRHFNVKDTISKTLGVYRELMETCYIS